MKDADAITFTRLSDGTLLRRDPDGAFRPTASRTDRAGLAALTEAEIERMAASDPDHPGLDDAFWEGVADPPPEEPVSISLDRDVARYFRRAGPDTQARVNAVLRDFMRTGGEAG